VTLTGLQLFGLLLVVSCMTGVTIQKIFDLWTKVLCSREETKRAELKAAAKRAEADAKAVAAWTPPPDTITWGMIKDGRLHDE